MALNNCTINSASVNVTKGQALGSGVANQVLTITPNTGYVVDHNDFTIASPPTGISSITKANSGVAYADDNKVIITCDLDNSYVANANVFFTIDVDGDAVDKKARPWTFAGTWDQVVNSNITAAPITNLNGNAYSGSNTQNNKTQLFVQTYTAASGYYFSAAPTFTPTSVGTYANNYQSVITETAWSAGKVTAYKVEVSFTSPAANVTGHNIDVNGGTVVAFSAADNLVSGVTLDQSNLPLKNATRTIRIYGNSGCSIQVSVRTNNATNYDIVNNTSTSSGSEAYCSNITMPSTGFYEDIIEIPDNTTGSNVTTVIKVKGGTSPATNTTTGGSNSNNTPFEITLNQRPSISVVTTASSSNYNTVNTNNTLVANFGSNVDKFGNPFGGKDLSIAITHTSGKNLYLRRQPVFRDDINYLASNSTTISGTTNDFTNTRSSANGGTDFEILGLTASGNGTGTITVASNVGGYAVITGGTTSPVQSVLNIDNFVNQAPLSNALSINVDYQTAKAISLSASDPESDTLTYSIVGNPSNGALSGLNTATGAVTYTPNLSYSGSDSFTYKVNDGFEDSNTATVSLTVASGGGGSVARYEMEFYNNNGVLAGVHYIHATQTCQSGSLAVTCMDFGNLTNKWVRWRTVAGGCSSTEQLRGKIKGAVANGTPTAYVSGDTYYNSMSDAAAGTNGVTC